MFKRLDFISEPLKVQSQFLFGPRQTGKSTLLASLFHEALRVDLLDQTEARLLLRNPESLGRRIDAVLASSHQTRLTVIIDEIQNQPELLNEVHRCLAQHGSELRFLLTGSSARKLRRQGVNLLGGRAGTVRVFPLVWSEVQSWKEKSISLEDCLQWGSMPHILREKENAQKLLLSYIQNYLEIEIRTEGLTRSLSDFSRFLEVAALANAQQISFRGLCSDVGVNEKTLAAWFNILEETLIGSLLAPFVATKKRKAVSFSKFYFFDCGVANAVLERFALGRGAPEQGVALECFMHGQLRAWCAAQSVQGKLHYWRTHDKKEVDFIVTQGRRPTLALEVKIAERVTPADLKGLLAFREEYPDCRAVIVTLGPKREVFPGGIEALPVIEFLESLWEEFPLVNIAPS